MLTDLEKTVLAACLKEHHKFVNGCWFTEYKKINQLIVHASTTNGTTGLGTYKGKPVYWYFNHKIDKFEIE